MNAKTFLSSTAVLLVAAVPALADTGEVRGGFDHRVQPARDSFEIAVGLGYAQGLGDVATGMEVGDVAGPGGSIELQLGYRIIPNLTLGAYGSLARFDQGDALDDDTGVWGGTAGIQGIVQFRPGSSVAPWASLGTGWKTLELSPDSGSTTTLQGLEIARVQVGVDYRLSPEVAIAPVIGGSLSTFLAEDSAMTDGHDEITDKEVHYSLFAGLQGRFNL